MNIIFNKYFMKNSHSDQQVYGKLFNIINHQGNANPNHNEVQPQENYFCQKSFSITIAGQ